MPIPQNPPKLNRISAKDMTLKQLRDWITQGILQPGEKINDSELAEALGVSRTPVREAFQLLEYQGFIEMIPGKETRIKPLVATDVTNIYRPLAALEAIAAEMATEKIGDKDIKKLWEYNQNFAKALEHQEGLTAMDWDKQLHQIIVNKADNPYLSTSISMLHMHAHRIEIIYFQQKGMPANQSIKEHEQLITALEQRNPHQAAEAMRHNWLRPMQVIAEQIRKSTRI
ncbi:GntR family transcriptional regulator [Kroppenstedtia pulmonis]|uniref:GntR family transcriptional regulator n=1 Tax=Kroppenstedtia pulmonis TaxID=1380685 RepID=A0A7D3XI57_9BACL|nr:GntR family transcriptional regulator [Kroppenstedtia pulmonis]QKG84244.1 GntR family transcriptional regulator [Kroppenstedtia pulmonis]